ncbi:hypothetical protein [Natrinema salsiterrestre]|uniref:Uncharacterized protein n=1 Tax=Natrinema salsiterrestre TaxID=2950540 RepID=A0A9Q4Q0R3_9EURY|nr:hypothetical protein [Natrinema salsiterrestre]MDF9744601.1 hypothetical protein [Natrinema salsiterrestre]
MVSRRSIVRTITGAVAGSIALAGRSLAGTAQSARRKRARPARTVSAPTTLSVSANRTAIGAAGVPGRLEPYVRLLDQRLGAVSLADIDAVTGTGGIAGDRLVAGTVIATGSFDADAIRYELRERSFAAAGSRANFERFVSGDGRVAVGHRGSTIVLGYGPGTALETVDARLGVREATATSRDRRTTPAATRHLERVLDGDAITAVALGPASSDVLSTVLAAESSPFAPLVGAVDAIGAGATVREESDRTVLQYGLVGDPDRLSTDRVRAALDDADTGVDTVRTGSLERDGRTIVVNADCSTDRLVDANLNAFRIDPSTVDRRRRTD